MATPDATDIAPTTTAALASGAWRPTAMDPTGSSRPLSSSERVNRTTISTLISPTTTRRTS